MGNYNKMEKDIQVMEPGYEKEDRFIETTRVQGNGKLLLFTLVSYFFCSFAVKEAANLFGNRIPFLQSTMCNILVSQTGLILPTVCFLWRNKYNPIKFLNIHFLHPLTMILLVVFAYASYPIISLCNYFSLQVSKNVVGGSLSSLFTEYPVWICVIVIAGIPCIVEEVIFRGALYQSYRSAGIIKAGIITAILFGFFHLNINQMSYAVVLGVLFIALNEITGSILSSMIVHFVINGTSVWLSSKTYSVAGNLTVDTANSMISSELMILVLGFMSLVSLVILGVILYVIVCLEKRQEEVKKIWETKGEQSGRILSPYLIATLLVCVGMILWNQIG